MSIVILSDDYINKLFQGTNFGAPINESVERKRELIKGTLKNQLEGFWCGNTIYKILIQGGFLIDSKAGQKKKLTQIGYAFLNN